MPCLASLTATILSCAASEDGAAIGACVAAAVGVGNSCYPCICWALYEVLGQEDWIDEFCG